MTKKSLKTLRFQPREVKTRQHLLDWYSIGAGFAVGVKLSLAETGANDRDSKLYRNAFGRWLKGQAWADEKEIDKATRSHAIWLHESRDAVEEFFATLPTNKRLKMNHPTTVRRAWDRAHKQAVEPDKQSAEKPRQVKIDVDELASLHADLDAANKELGYLKEDRPDADSDEGRIEELERQLAERDETLAERDATIETLQARIAEFEA